jgi:hypothetical protein
MKIIRNMRERHKKISSELGIATAEYAVTTVAACGFAGVLYKLLGKALSSFLF